MASLPTSRLGVAAVAVTALAVGAGASTAYAALDRPVPASAASADRYVETHLFFGTARPDGGAAVTDAQFRDFVTTTITPAFPAGLTVQTGAGQYRDAHGVIERERSYEVMLLYPAARSGANSARIDSIRAGYDRRFGQESVARVDEHATVDF